MITVEIRCLVFLLFMLNIGSPFRNVLTAASATIHCAAADTVCLRRSGADSRSKGQDDRVNLERILYMTFAILASFIGFLLIFSASLKRQERKAHEQDRQFWERENRANSIRRKPLDGLRYIKIPLETFPTHILQNDPEVLECISTLEALTSQKIVNLTGYTNTDLKLEYGTASITELSEYDQNYTVLVRTLQKWADILLSTGYVQEAAVLMEFAVSTGTDVGRTYYELADYWLSQGKTEQVEQLISMAEGLRTSARTTIVRRLREKCSAAH